MTKRCGIDAERGCGFWSYVMHVLCYLGRRTRCLDDGTLWYLLPFASASSARFASSCHLPVEMSGAGEYSSGASLDFASSRVVLHRIALFCISAGICGYLFDVTSVRYFGDYAHRGFSPLTSDIESIALLCPQRVTGESRDRLLSRDAVVHSTTLPVVMYRHRSSKPLPDM